MEMKERERKHINRKNEEIVRERKGKKDEIIRKKEGRAERRRKVTRKSQVG